MRHAWFALVFEAWESGRGASAGAFSHRAPRESGYRFESEALAPECLALFRSSRAGASAVFRGQAKGQPGVLTESRFAGKVVERIHVVPEGGTDRVLAWKATALRR